MAGRTNDATTPCVEVTLRLAVAVERGRIEIVDAGVDRPHHRDRLKRRVPHGAAGGGSEQLWKLVMLRQVVGDGEPRCLGADEDVPARADGRFIHQRSHGDMDEGAIADD